MTRAARDLFAGQPDKEPAQELSERLDGGRVAGLDEAGRGPLAGPVVAAAVVLDPDRPIPGLNDSKKLDHKRREELLVEIYERALVVGVGVAEAERIDEINILRASLEAMAVAFSACEEQLGEEIPGAVVDGKIAAPLEERVRQRTVVGGDAISPPIMAASIVAKVLRDRRMKEEGERYPAYGFERHKGYPTPAHREALMAHGPCPLHRRTFSTVREATARVTTAKKAGGSA
jgi:ribonuclease HII